MIRCINELIESLLLVINDWGQVGVAGDQSSDASSHHRGRSVVARGGHDDNIALKKPPSFNQGANMTLAKMQHQQDPLMARHADWARTLEVVAKRRTEVLMPENLENMWTKGRNYKKKENKKLKAGPQDSPAKSPATDSVLPERNLTKEKLASKPGKYADPEGMSSPQAMHALNSDPLINFGSINKSESSGNPDKELLVEGEHQVDQVNGSGALAYRSRLKKSNSTSVLGIQPQNEGGPIISEFYSPDFERNSEGFQGKSASDMVIRKEGQLFPKLRCRVCILATTVMRYNILEKKVNQIIFNRQFLKAEWIITGVTYFLLGFYI